MKIGVSAGKPLERNRLLARIQKIQACNALEVVLLATAWVYEYRDVERDLHAQYQEHRVRGEWFLLPDVDVAILIQWLAAADLSERVAT